MKSGRRFGMLRKVCAVAVASVLAAGCLTACGSSKNTGPLTLDQIKENGKLTVATEAAYEPFEYMDGDKIIGYNADRISRISRRSIDTFANFLVGQTTEAIILGSLCGYQAPLPCR